jgi:hypothetical protein
MRAVVAVLVLVSLAGCGYSRGERAVSGGLLGAGAGAGVSALTGGGIGTGALIGGGLGAAGGALTAPSRRSYYGGGGYRGGYRRGYY